MLGPSIWVLAGVGFTNDLSSRGREFFSAESISGLLLLIFAGILYAILTFAPVSPAGPVLTGAAFLGVTIWAFNSPEAYASLWAPEVAKDGFDLSRPGYGLAGLLAIPLLGTALSARRWARYEPPVLPIIGEIGRFRGAAKVAGTPVAAEQTTVIRPATTPPAVVPPSADPTVALPSINRPATVTPPPAKPATAPPAQPTAPAPAEPTVALDMGAAKPPSDEPVTRPVEQVERDAETVQLDRPTDDRTPARAPDPDATALIPAQRQPPAIES
ncbi:hypothetical protein GCM10025331_03530 [Actinoplanes utahensis]|uniref:Uncharacterized protein n=1 Tax=Actinoplanes utahensis TaxID=1869 RepID=A0A0A6UWZ0_ACTUT|nr:hypothetical protein MB27_02270 [Actinoplanes utahensis]GIF28095.1 hypothetical protein Aut01nite_10810 [Actinoplanes utahensis]